MTRFPGFLLVCLGAFAALPATAQRAPVPIVDHDNVAFATASGIAPADDQVRQAIGSAAASQQWEVQDTGPGRLIASLSVRNKHQVSTEIAYSPATYSIRYRDSVNMNYRPGEGGIGPGTIHPFYNRWVDGLDRAIRQSLSRLP